ncbi:YkgJ family cysteine cluster protein [Flavobacterium sp.]|jgi:Fe-S-cluster containining protein|uniref:YkgJ family cysteine cluster protein n=1 Tax=Flavobacterium sp. TaxID=239 RepID=UPI002A83DEA5|nr:YkgJ family cysteine cluster protein [Flavobacterium sp.]
MSIEEKVQLVNELYQNLETEIKTFQTHTRLSCVVGCGKCCSTPDIDASPLEFLPWAFHVFMEDEAEKKLTALNDTTTPNCHLYQPKSIEEYTKGQCSDYKHRGLICRLFGYGATTDKYGQLRIASCNIIKEGQKENFDKSTIAINNGLAIPIFTEYYMQLSQIDFRMGNVFVPVNKAMKLALEEVLQYYAYRPFPDNYKGEKH